MIDNKLQKEINRVMQVARQKKLEFVTVEHLLLSLLYIDDVIVFLKKKDILMNNFKSDLESYIEENTPVLPESSEIEATPTVGFQRVLQRAVYHAQSAQKDTVYAMNVLVAIFAEKESYAAYLLNLNDISRLDVTDYLASLSQPIDFDDKTDTERKNLKRKKSDPLSKFTTNLNELAQQGKIDPLLGRQAELSRAIQILARRRKNNPVFVGHSGVGKTAIVQGLAKKIVDKKVPKILTDKIIYTLDISQVIAGTKFRGDFEERLNGILAALKEKPNAILFIDEIHTIIGAGSVTGSAMDASNLLKPALADGTLKCIGSTTYDEFRRIFSKDQALSRRFQKIDVDEPNVDEAIQILHGLKKTYQDYHKVKYSDAALSSAVELSHKYLTDRKLPDKAIDIIDEIGAYQQTLAVSKRKKNISTADVENIIAQIAKIPSKQVSSNDKTLLKDLKNNLMLNVFGQESAIDCLTTAIKLARSGLANNEKPIGSFLFAGPTGVGKTEVCKQLARIMGVELLRFDMSEYMERHSVSRLIGSPPGYVGHEEGGLLTEKVNQNPHAVLLLDEIEKAHPDIDNILLQVMDRGTLTDSNGREVDFRHVILVMTSNVGSVVAGRASIGFNQQDHNSDINAELKKAFSPEFRNRLTNTIYFNSLDERTILFIVNKFLFDLESALERKNVSLTVTEAARKWLAENGYDKQMGARPMARLIEQKISTPLADELLFDQLTTGGKVVITVEKSKLKINVSSPNN